MRNKSDFQRVGVVVPSSNTSVETELARWLPDDVTLHSARLPQVSDVKINSVEMMIEQIEAQSRLLATAALDLIVIAATVPTLLKGLGWDQQIIKTLTAVTGTPVTTTATEMIAGLRDVRAKRVVLATPFIEEMNKPIVAFLNANGFEVLADTGLGVRDNVEIGRLPPESAREAVRKVDRAEADAIVMVCTNWAVLDAIEPIEQEHGKTVIGTTQVTLRGILKALGRPARMPNLGRLLRDDLMAGAV